ncbi:methylated-DNA--[protein]-cysteine S-methyltransferase [Calditrichota bacterium LG25]
MYWDYLNTPLGWIKLVANQNGLLEIQFVPQPEKTCAPNSITTAARKQLEEYFSAERTAFNLPLEPRGTEFQKQVWQALQTIPFGQTVSYKDIARMINNPKALRAVGLANGRNPIPIIIPCHRVIAADGTIGGFSAGLWRKHWLLHHERVLKN